MIAEYRAMSNPWAFSGLQLNKIEYPPFVVLIQEFHALVATFMYMAMKLVRLVRVLFRATLLGFGGSWEIRHLFA